LYNGYNEMRYINACIKNNINLGELLTIMFIPTMRIGCFISSWSIVVIITYLIATKTMPSIIDYIDITVFLIIAALTSFKLRD